MSFGTRITGGLARLGSFSARWIPLIVLLAASAFLLWVGSSLDLSALGPEGLVAVIAVLSSAIVAVATLANSQMSAEAQRRHERQLAHDSRIWIAGRTHTWSCY